MLASSLFKLRRRFLLEKSGELAITNYLKEEMKMTIYNAIFSFAAGLLVMVLTQHVMADNVDVSFSFQSGAPALACNK